MTIRQAAADGEEYVPAQMQTTRDGKIENTRKQLEGKAKQRAKPNKRVTNTKARLAWGETIQRGLLTSVESGQ